MKDKRTGTGVPPTNRIESAAAEVRRMLGDEILEKAGSFGVALDETLAFAPMGAQLEQARESEGLTLKELARELAVAQHRIRDIEHGRVEKILPELLHRLIERFALQEGYAEWADAHPEIASKLA